MVQIKNEQAGKVQCIDHSMITTKVVLLMQMNSGTGHYRFVSTGRTQMLIIRVTFFAL